MAVSDGDGLTRPDVRVVPPGIPLPMPQVPVPGIGLPGAAVPVVREPVRPSYAHHFGCIASACEDTCCKGWGVAIDQGTWEKYRSVEAMKPHLGTLIVLNTHAPSTRDYARFASTPTSVCSFLETDRLCGIEKALGADMLPTTCAVYPRVQSKQFGANEMALHLSCPEAARVTLGMDELVFEGAWLGHARGRYDGLIADALQAGDRDPRPLMREFVLLVLRDRSYALWERMYLLSVLAERMRLLSETSAVQWPEMDGPRVHRALVESAHSMAQRRLQAVLAKQRADPGLQLGLLTELVRQRVSQPPLPQRFVECVQDFELGLGCTAAANGAEVLEAYAKACERYYLPLMKAHPHLLENYLMNYVFSNGTPFVKKVRAFPGASVLNAGGVEGDSESEHGLMCLHLGVVQMLLIGMAGRYREQFGMEHVVKVVQSFARTFEHSQEALDKMVAFARVKDLLHPRGTALLLKLEDRVAESMVA